MAANVVYALVAGFTATVEIDYGHYGIGMVDPSNVNSMKADKKDCLGGILSFQRSF